MNGKILDGGAIKKISSNGNYLANNWYGEWETGGTVWFKFEMGKWVDAYHKLLNGEKAQVKIQTAQIDSQMNEEDIEEMINAGLVYYTGKSDLSLDINPACLPCTFAGIVSKFNFTGIFPLSASMVSIAKNSTNSNGKTNSNASNNGDPKTNNSATQNKQDDTSNNGAKTNSDTPNDDQPKTTNNEGDPKTSNSDNGHVTPGASDKPNSGTSNNGQASNNTGNPANSNGKQAGKSDNSNDSKTTVKTTNPDTSNNGDNANSNTPNNGQTSTNSAQPKPETSDSPAKSNPDTSNNGAKQTDNNGQAKTNSSTSNNGDPKTSNSDNGQANNNGNQTNNAKSKADNGDEKGDPTVKTGAKQTSDPTQSNNAQTSNSNPTNNDNANSSDNSAPTANTSNNGSTSDSSDNGNGQSNTANPQANNNNAKDNAKFYQPVIPAYSQGGNLPTPPSNTIDQVMNVILGQGVFSNDTILTGTLSDFGITTGSSSQWASAGNQQIGQGYMGQLWFTPFGTQTMTDLQNNGYAWGSATSTDYTDDDDAYITFNSVCNPTQSPIAGVINASSAKDVKWVKGTTWEQIPKTAINFKKLCNDQLILQGIEDGIIILWRKNVRIAGTDMIAKLPTQTFDDYLGNSWTTPLAN